MTTPTVLDEGRYSVTDTRGRHRIYHVTETNTGVLEIYAEFRHSKPKRVARHLDAEGLVMTGIGAADGHARHVEAIMSDPLAARVRYAETTGRCARCNRAAEHLVEGYGLGCITLVRSAAA